LMELLDKLNKVGKKIEENVPKAGPCSFSSLEETEFGIYTDIYSRCCEDDDTISNGGLKIAGTANIPLIGVECGYRFEVKKFLKGFLGVGVGLAAQLEANADFSPCASDLTCKVENSAKVSAEVYVAAEIEVLSGLAGASLKGSASVSVGPTQHCTTLCKYGLVTGDPAAFLLSSIPTDCSTTVDLCFGPVVATGRLKLFGFIRIGFTYRVPGTTWCTQL
jgi:hypothetical protein